MRIIVSVVMAGALIASAGMAAPAPGKGGDKPQPIGAKARAQHGPEPLARPSDDVGMAEDPADANGQAAQPPLPPPPPAKPAKPK